MPAMNLSKDLEKKISQFKNNLSKDRFAQLLSDISQFAAEEDENNKKLSHACYVTIFSYLYEVRIKKPDQTGYYLPAEWFAQVRSQIFNSDVLLQLSSLLQEFAQHALPRKKMLRERLSESVNEVLANEALYEIKHDSLDFISPYRKIQSALLEASPTRMPAVLIFTGVFFGLIAIALMGLSINVIAPLFFYVGLGLFQASVVTTAAGIVYKNGLFTPQESDLPLGSVQPAHPSVSFDILPPSPSVE